MDSFGMWWKPKWNYFSSLNHNVIVLCELSMLCHLFAQKCSNCSNCQETTKNIKMFGVPPNTLPLAIYIGIFCYWVLLHLQYMSFKTIAGGFNGAFWWFGVLSEDREKNCWIHQNYLVALTYLMMKKIIVSLKSIIITFCVKIRVWLNRERSKERGTVEPRYKEVGYNKTLL